MKKDYLSLLLRSKNSVFTFKDLSLIWEETDAKLALPEKEPFWICFIQILKEIYKDTSMGPLLGFKGGPAALLLPAF